jgi:hypothetical protein
MKSPIGRAEAIAMTANSYERRFGEWPSSASFRANFFAAFATSRTPRQLELLATVWTLTVSEFEPSPRLTVAGALGRVTYDEGITRADWDQQRFFDWLLSEAQQRAIDVDVDEFL